MDVKSHNNVLILILGIISILWPGIYFKNQIFPLSWVALAPAIVVLRNVSNKALVFYTWLFGFFVYLFHSYWFAHGIYLTFYELMSSSQLSGYAAHIISALIAFSIFIILCAYHGFSYVLIFALARYIGRNSDRKYHIIFPVVATAIDYFYLKIYHDQIAYFIDASSTIAQIACIFGAPLITFTIICFNSFLSYLTICCKSMNRKNIAFSVAYSVFLLAVIISALRFGIKHKNALHELELKANTAKIGIVQANYNEREKLNTKNFFKMIVDYNSMSIELQRDTPDLIVWPETSIPELYYVSDKSHKAFQMTKKFKGSPLLFGCPVNHDNKLFNAMLLLSDDCKLLDYYFKNKLFSISEKTRKTLSSIFPKLKERKNFSNGNNQKIMKVGGFYFTPTICSEILYPNYIRKSIIKDGEISNFIVNAANDSWFGKSVAPRMTLNVAKFRAVETARYVIRTTCTGISAVVTATGEMEGQIDEFTRGKISGKIPLLSYSTVYSRWGWIFIYFLAVILVLLLLHQLFGVIYKHAKIQMCRYQ